jgi:peptide/nickel transport system substrate-binding protein/oligopeptide transport system substrate-binding protein
VSLLAALLAGACSSRAEHSAKEQALTYQYVPFNQLDPQRVSDGAPIAGQDLLEGLVTPDAAGTSVRPATADTWTISQDGTVYTFHIRSGARWSDGTPVTAQDFEWTYKRLLTPSTSALDTLYGSSSYQTDLGIKNALNFQLGQVTDWSQVGVKALDASHLRIVLDAPNASFLQGMAQTSMVPLPEKNLTRFPYSWQTPAHWVGNGPFVMKSWTPNSSMVLVPNEKYWDRKAVHLTRVNISMAPATDAQLRTRYEHHELDLAQLGNPVAFTKDPALSQALTRLDQFSVNFLTLIPSRNPALADVRVRQAIALAIGRAQVAQAGPLVKPSTSLVPSTLPGFDASVGFQQNITKARRLMAEAGYPGSAGFPTFSIMTDHNDPYVQAVVDTLQQNLGIRAGQDVEDPGVYSAKRHEVQPASFVGYFSTAYTGILTWQHWVSYLYPPTQTELLSLKPDEYTRYQVLQAQGTARSLSAASNFLDAHASPQSVQFAAVAANADATANPDRAAALYKQAAAIRQGTYEFIPYAYGALVYAIRPSIKGVHLWTGYFTISFKDVSIG